MDRVGKYEDMFRHAWRVQMGDGDSKEQSGGLRNNSSAGQPQVLWAK